ncbi:MAG: beta-ketoacyl-ACP synthase II [Bdellovibrionales bacterium]|nr:beta-ketoacyl-ACP synthase II [Bdellovibrionales bacterium]
MADFLKDNIYLKTQKPQRRVVVTGMGILSPVGNSVLESWENVIAGKSGIDKITAFDASSYSSQIAGEVKNFNPEDFIHKKELKKMDRFIQLSIAASMQAWKDCGLDISEELCEKTGVIIGVGMGGLPQIEIQHSIQVDRGPNRISPFFIPSVITNLAAGQVSIKYGFNGPNYSVTSACASSNHSIGDAYRFIRDGVCDVMLAGGAESTICPMAVGGFAAMKALSTRNEQPSLASRPWDQNRDGFVLAEGAATLILEDYEHAARRGAKIYAEVSGYGLSADAHHMTSPAPQGKGAAHAMRMTLNDAQIKPEEIDYINAHGTSTPTGDGLECEAVKSVFKEHAKNLMVSSTKSMTGHALGAAGALESVFSIMALETGVIPPTINLDEPSPECDLDFVPLKAKQKQIKHALNNSFGFGGTNACILFSKI